MEKFYSLGVVCLYLAGCSGTHVTPLPAGNGGNGAGNTQAAGAAALPSATTAPSPGSPDPSGSSPVELGLSGEGGADGSESVDPGFSLGGHIDH
jgi:hypothetical protein